MVFDFDELRDFLDSDEGQELIKREKYKQEIINKRFKKFEEYLKTHDFDKLIYRIILEHNDEWFETCRINGCEPYPNNKLRFILNYISHNYEPVTVDIDEINCDFPNIIYDFKNYYFQDIYGQGTITRIYNKFDNRLLLQV